MVISINFFGAKNSVFIISFENNRFSISTSIFWAPNGGEETINKLNSLLDFRSPSDIELPVKKAEKRSTRIERDNSGFNLAGFHHFKSETLAELKRVKNKDLEDMVYRMELPYDEIVDIMDVKIIAGSIIGYFLPPGIYEFTDNK